MRQNLKKLVPYIGVAVLLLSPVFVSAQSAPLQSAGDELLASLGSFIVHFLGSIHFLGNVDFGSVGVASSGATVPTVTPGTGWNGPTAQPPQIGANTDDAIAAWDVVPFQTYTGTFSIGVVAFHNKGIDYVAIACDGGPWTNIYTPTYNPSTATVEYWAKANASAVSGDGRHECRAIAYPVSGVPRVLSSKLNVASINTTTNVLSQPAHGYQINKMLSFSGNLSCLSATTTYYVITAGWTDDTYEVSTTKGGGAVNLSGCTDSNIVVTPVGAGAYEVGATNGAGSLWFNTNAGGTLNTAAVTAHVDTAGSDSNACTSGSPCATIYGAITNITPAQSGNSFTVSSASPAVLSRTGQGFKLGQMVVLSGSPPAAFQPSIGYWVVSSSGNNIELAATPGGVAINNTGSAGSALVSYDFGGDTICLDGTAGNPQSFTYSKTTIENTTRNALYQWLNIAPCLGQNGAYITLAAQGNSNGLRTQKVHIQGIQENGNFSIPFTTYAGWMDSTNSIGPGHTVVGSGAVSGTSNVGNVTSVYWTNATVTQYEVGEGFSLLVNGVTASHIGQAAFNDDLLVINSVATYTGEDQNDPVTTSGDSPSGQNVINFGSNALPSLLATGWIAYGNSCITASTIQSFTTTAPYSITLSGNLTCDVASGASISVGTGFHPDVDFVDTAETNIITYGLTSNVYMNAQGIFTQSATGISDWAVVNSDLESVLALNSFGVLLENNVDNMYFHNDVFNSGNLRTGSNALSATDVVFDNSSCGVDSPLGAYSGVNDVNSPSSNPC